NGRLEDTAYIGDSEATVYAIAVITGQMRWRFNVGSQLQYAPAVTGDDVYATAEGNGMYRIARATGEPLCPAIPGSEPQVRLRSRQERPPARSRPRPRHGTEFLRHTGFRLPHFQ